MHPVLIHRQQGKKENNIRREKQSDEKRIRSLMGGSCWDAPFRDRGPQIDTHQGGGWIQDPSPGRPPPPAWRLGREAAISGLASLSSWPNPS